MTVEFTEQDLLAYKTYKETLDLILDCLMIQDDFFIGIGELDI